MNITFQLDFTGTPDADDELAMQHIVFLENQRRERQNVQIELTNAAAQIENERRAAQSPPGTPIPIIPLVLLLGAGLSEDLTTSYLFLLTQGLTNQHLSDTKLAKSITGIAARYTKEETEKIFANLTVPLNKGKSAAEVTVDTDVLAVPKAQASVKLKK